MRVASCSFCFPLLIPIYMGSLCPLCVRVWLRRHNRREKLQPEVPE